MTYAYVTRWVVAGGGAIAIALAGCGGGGEPEHVSASGTRAHASTASTSYQPGPPAAAPGGAFSGFSGGGGGGGSRHGGGGPSGGIAGALYDRTVRQRALTERSHMGPERLDGTDPEQRRTEDWSAATSSAHPVTSPTDDDCDRLWAQHVATTEAYHARRHDGLHSAISPARERAFLTSCRAQPLAARQCMDRDYLVAHADECQAMRETGAGAQAHRQLQRAARETPIPGHGT